MREVHFIAVPSTPAPRAIASAIAEAAALLLFIAGIYAIAAGLTPPPLPV